MDSTPFYFLPLLRKNFFRSQSLFIFKRQIIDMKLKRKYTPVLEKSDHIQMIKVLNLIDNMKDNVFELENPDIFMEPN